MAGFLLWQYPGLVEPLEPTLTTAQNLDWLRETQIPVLLPPVAPVLEVSVVGPVDTPAPDVPSFDWFRPLQEPVRPILSSLPDGGEVYPGEPSLVTAQNLDWLRPTQIPVLLPPVPPVTEGYIVGPPDTTIDVVQSLDWLRPTQEPVRAISHAVLEGGEFSWIEQTLFVDQNLDWLRPTSEPVRLVPSVLDDRDTLPVQVFDLFEWIPPQEQPYPSTVSHVPADGVTVFDVGLLTVQNIDWFRPVQEPVREVPRPIQAGETSQIDPSLIVEQNLDWLRPTQQPLPADPGVVNDRVLSAFVEVVPLVVDLDVDWITPTEQPPATTLSALQLGGVEVTDPTLYVPQTLDWLRDTEQPIFIPRRLTEWEPPFYVDDSLLVAQNLDWLRETQVPMRLPPPVLQGLSVGTEWDTPSPLLVSLLRSTSRRIHSRVFGRVN